MSNTRCKAIIRLLAKDYRINKEKYQEISRKIRAIFEQYNLKDCSLEFCVAPITINRIGDFTKREDSITSRIRIVVSNVLHKWNSIAPMINLDEYDQELDKYLNAVFDHEYRHYQQFKYLEDNGLNWIEYDKRIKKIDYQHRLIEVDAIIYSTGDRSILSLDAIGEDYYATWMRELDEQIENETDPELKEKLLLESKKVIDDYHNFKSKIKSGDKL